jgi:glutamyl-Q tRNA(Asp) synthetase
LAAALASCLEARAHAGQWLLRIEDLDGARVVPGMADEHLRTLENCGFQWDGEILYQSSRRAIYEEAIAALGARGLLYECSCSRRQLEGIGDEAGYPGTCRKGPTGPGPTALRLHVEDSAIESWEDAWQGHCAYRLGRLGDVIVRRRDGVHAYQLAVVVDDAAQQVTHVVRGVDLLDSTPWQRAIQRALGLPLLHYAHLPLITEPSGQKLAKSRRSVPVHAGAVAIWEALQLLRQQPPRELALAPIAELWAWARASWTPGRLRGLASLPALS